MISKSQIMRMCFECRAILHADICPHCGSSNIGYSMIELSLLLELRQQLLYELKNNLLNKRKFNSELESLQNTFVFDACRIVRKVLGVEGEK